MLMCDNSTVVVYLNIQGGTMSYTLSHDAVDLRLGVTSFHRDSVGLFLERTLDSFQFKLQNQMTTLGSSPLGCTCNRSNGQSSMIGFMQGISLIFVSLSEKTSSSQFR